MDGKQFRTELDNFMQDQGIGTAETQLSNTEKLNKFGLTTLSATKNILGDIYAYTPPQGAGILRKVKNKIINVVRNVTISTIESAIIKQNKYNEVNFQLVEHLMQENLELRKELEQLKQAKL